MGFLAIVFTSFAATNLMIDAANSLAENGYIIDYSKDIKKYNLDKPILRQEAIGIITKVNGLIKSNNSTYSCKNIFRDVTKKDGWVCYVAEKAADQGVVNGKNSTFRPKDKMTHYEAMVLALKWSCIQPSNNSDSESAQDQTLTIALYASMITGSMPEMNQPITRGEFFYYITQAQIYKNNHPERIDSNLPGCSAINRVIKNGDTVRIHYVGTLDNGEQFDSSRERWEPLEFIIGKGSMIKWFEEAVQTMKVGEKKKVRILAKDAYGEAYIEKTIPLSEYKESITQRVPINALIGTTEQTMTKTQIETFFGNVVIGSEKKIGEATLKIISISGDNVIVSIDEPQAPFYGKNLSVGMKAVGSDGSDLEIKSINGDTAEVEIRVDAVVVKRTSTGVSIKIRNSHPLAGKALNFEIELLNIKS